MILGWREWSVMGEMKPSVGKPRHRHETSDADVRAIFISGVALLVFIVIGLLVSGGVFHYFVRTQHLGPPASPFEDVRTLPPQPRLQAEPAQDMKQYLEEQQAILDSYGWEDRKAGIVRIPTERAMDLALQQGFPVRSQTMGHAGGRTASTVKSAGRFARRGREQTTKLGSTAGSRR
jgi:hypothetical protein